MTRIGPGIVAAGAWAIFLVLATAYAAGRLSVETPPNACPTTIDCSRCAPEDAAGPSPPTAPATEGENAEDAGTPPRDSGREPTLAFPTELPRRNRGWVIEVPVEAELAPTGTGR